MRVLNAKLLVGLGELSEAEIEVAAQLEEAPDDLTALNLFAKIKHMKGELSQAVACWAHLHARSPHNELTRLQLTSLLDLARDPERHAADFIALDQKRANNKNLAVPLELEKAFKQLIARRTDEAMAICESLASKQRNKDRDLYKLCVMAKAWIAELSGKSDIARHTLEELGKERGFETDTDRVLALARIYERSSEEAQLEKATHVYNYLDRNFEKISAQSRLASLYRKLGRDATAEEHERRFRLAFERRMHRPSRAEIARAAATRYVPLERLKAVRLSSDTKSDLDLNEHRQHAIFAWLSGDVSAAREKLERGAQVNLIDRKYLADLRAQSGDVDAAVELFLATLSDDPLDPHIVSFVLAHWERTEDVRVQQALLETKLGERVRVGLESMVQRNPRRASVWLAMSSLSRLRGDDRVESTRLMDRARALEDARQRDERPIGRVLAAAVYNFLGKSKGLVHQVWADRKPTDAAGRLGGFLKNDDILGNVTSEMRQAVRNTFLAVREFARSRFPHRTADILDYDYTYKVTKEDEPSGGLSAGLPTALAFLSVFLQEPIPQDIAFSGVVIADSHDVLVIRSVGDVEYKVKAGYHKNLRAVVVPSENRFEIANSQHVPQAICKDIVQFVASFDEAIAFAFGDRIWLD